MRVDESGLTRKSMKKEDYEQMSSELFLCTSKVRGIASPVIGPMLKVKAIEVYKNFEEGKENVSASDRFINTWKKY